MGISNERFYDSDYMRARELWQDAYPAMARAIEATFGRTSIVDVGCARGDLVEALRLRGFAAFGADGAAAASACWPARYRESYLVADLTSAELELPRAELVSSFEVAEHLPQALPRSSSRISRGSSRSGCSSAPPPRASRATQAT